MKDEACTKQSPKKFEDDTEHDYLQMYIIYRRRCSDRVRKTASITSRTVHGSSLETQTDNSWVVTFSSRLSITFEWNLNVRLCMSGVAEIM